VAGQTLILPEEAWQGLGITFRFVGADADLTLLTAGDGRVASDADFVFYNQPATADGAARLLGKRQEGAHTAERATLHLSALRREKPHGATTERRTTCRARVSRRVRSPLSPRRLPRGCYIASSRLRNLLEFRSGVSAGAFNDLEESPADGSLEAALRVA